MLVIELVDSISRDDHTHDCITLQNKKKSPKIKFKALTQSQL